MMMPSFGHLRPHIDDHVPGQFDVPEDVCHVFGMHLARFTTLGNKLVPLFGLNTQEGRGRHTLCGVTSISVPHRSVPLIVDEANLAMTQPRRER